MSSLLVNILKSNKQQDRAANVTLNPDSIQGGLPHSGILMHISSHKLFFWVVFKVWCCKLM